MKWGIILLAVILIVGTMFDLYFSLAVRTFYLTLYHYPDILEVTSTKSNVKQKINSSSKANTESNNVT